MPRCALETGLPRDEHDAPSRRLTACVEDEPGWSLFGLLLEGMLVQELASHQRIALRAGEFCNIAHVVPIAPDHVYLVGDDVSGFVLGEE